MIDYLKIGLAVAVVAAIGGLYVLWRSAAADAVSAEAKLAQSEHNVAQLHANAVEAAEASRKLASANTAASATIVAKEAENSALAQRLQDLMKEKADAPLAACFARPLPPDVLRALPR